MSLSKKRIAITGSKGYIGQHLVKMLSKHSDQYYVIEFEGDVTDPMSFESCHTLIHLAAKVRVNESIKKPYKYYFNNINGTFNVANRFVYENFIFASSATVTNPINPYALSKKACEDVILEKVKEKNTDYTIFRFYNVTGSDGFAPTNPEGLFYNLIQAEKTGEFNVFGNDYNTHDGTCIRDYIHVNEVCEALIKAIELPANKIENLGSGTGFSVNEMIDAFKQVNKVDFKVNHLPRREGDLESLVLDNVSEYMRLRYSLLQLMKVG